MSSTTDYQELEALARKGRWLAISTVAGSGAGHVGGPFSAMDIMVALYFRSVTDLFFPKGILRSGSMR